jgi:sulfide:quinone oxidoreductase
MKSVQPQKTVMVLGGGFAALEAAIHLRRAGFAVTLISERDYLYVYPISIWVPVRAAEFEDVCIPLADLQKAHGFDWVVDEVLDIKLSEKRVIGRRAEYRDFDYLVIAVGAGKMKHPGIEHTLSICGRPEDALRLRDRIDELRRRGRGRVAVGFGGNPNDPSAVRGGPAFEFIFNLRHRLKREHLAGRFEFTFFAPMATPGARLGPRSLQMLDVFFNRLKIKKHFGKKIRRFEPDGVVFEDESKLESDLTMFIPASDGHAALRQSGLPLNDAGFVKINDHCEVEHGVDSSGRRLPVFAIGDCAAIEGPDWKAKQGHIAEVMARTTAYNISQMEAGSTRRKGYKHHVNILCVMDSGDGAALVYRDDRRAVMLPMPLVGHALKKAWGWYYRNSKLRRIPRIPGL